MSFNMDSRDWQDLQDITRMVAEPLQAIAGNLAEIRENLDAIIANGATITVSIKIGETLE